MESNFLEIKYSEMDQFTSATFLRNREISLLDLVTPFNKQLEVEDMKMYTFNIVFVVVEIIAKVIVIYLVHTNTSLGRHQSHDILLDHL